MKISIITATYNSAATVADTLNCIRDQRYPDIEHLVIDGDSKDETLKLVAEYRHVKKVVSEPDQGIYDAMNKGISLCTGEVIGILNSDDVYTDEHVLEDVMQLFSDPEVMAVYADLQYVKQDDITQVVRTWKSGKYRKNSFYYGWMPPHPTFFVRRSVYEKVGVFNTTLRSAADYEMMLRILVKFEITAKYLPRVIVRMRSGGMSNASFKNRLKANREDYLAWKLNALKPHFFTVFAKPFRKIKQFLIK